MERDWKSLPSDILPEIYKFISFPVDKVRFRSVCKEWRDSVQVPRAYSNFISNPASPREIRFFGERIYVYVKSRSNEGSLVKIQNRGNGNVRATHPFMTKPYAGRLQFSEFSIFEIARFYFRYDLGNVAVSVKDLGAEFDFSDFRFMGINQNGGLVHGSLDGSVLENVDGCSGTYDDIVYRRDKFYAVDNVGNLRMVDSCMKNEVVKFKIDIDDGRKYLVESNSKLYMLSGIKLPRDSLHFFDYYLKWDHGIQWFRIFQFDDESESWSEVSHIGNSVIFVQPRCHSFSVTITGDFQLSTNCVYFSPKDDICGVFDIKASTTRWFSDKNSPYIWPPRL